MSQDSEKRFADMKNDLDGPYERERGDVTSRRVRVHGTLDIVRCSDRVFELVTNSGERVRAMWVLTDLAPLTVGINHAVLIEGEALFGPTGTLIRVDADAIRLAQQHDEYFSTLPHPANVATSANETAGYHVGAQNGYESIAGTWPGDETIEELLETLADLDRRPGGRGTRTRSSRDEI